MALVLTHGEVPANYARNFAAILDHPDPLVVGCDEIAKEIPGIWTPSTYLDRGRPYVSDAAIENMGSRLVELLEGHGYENGDPISVLVDLSNNDRSGYALQRFVHASSMALRGITDNVVRGNEQSAFSMINARHWILNGPELTTNGDSDVFCRIRYGYPVVATLVKTEKVPFDQRTDKEKVVETVTTYKKTFHPNITDEQRQVIDDIMVRQNSAIDEACSDPSFDEFLWDQGGYDDVVNPFDIEREEFLRTLG